MKHQYRIQMMLFLVTLTILQACDSKLNKENPNSVVVKSYFTNTNELTTALNGVYAVLQDPQLVSREWFFVNDLRSDDMATGGGQLETPRYQLLIGTNDASNAVSTNFWVGLYGVIHRANAILEFAPNAITSSDADKALYTRLLGETKFLRAWAYFELVSIWGKVPLYDKTVKSIGDAKAVSTEDEVYTSIIGNLTEAIASLPLSYSGANTGRVTKGAARALLARVYMQRGDYPNAQIHLNEIINVEKQYSLTFNYNDNFMEEMEYNTESVFEVGFGDSNGNYGWGYNQGNGQGAETTVHNQEINPISWGNLIPSLHLLQAFEPDDPRYKFSFYEVGDEIVTGPLTLSQFNIASSTINGVTKKVGWRKHTILYKNATNYYPSGNNERVIRYAEVLLMMAECVNETGGTEADVLAYLNQLRQRPSVNMVLYPTATYPTTTKDERFTAIAHEKQVELAGEEIRNRDILRWRKQGKLALIGGEPITYYNASYEFLPIPQTEADNNPNI